MKIAFIGANIIDGTGVSVKKNRSLLVEENKIVEISQQKEFGSEYYIFDVTGKTIMPGLIDCHQHLAGWAQILISMQQFSLAYLHGKTVTFMRACLDVGVTTVRDMGGLEFGFYQAQKDGLIPGPRIQTCINQIQPTNGMLDWMPGVGGAITPQGRTASIPGLPSIWANGPWEMRAKVREMLRYGAQVIKIFNAPHPTARIWTDSNRPIFTDEEMYAVIDESHNAGVSVACHTWSLPQAKQAVKFGVDSIEHGPDLDDETLDRMAEKGIFLVPTYLIFNFHATLNPDLVWREIAQGFLKRHLDLMPRARRAGVKTAMGTDAGLSFGDVPGELAWMVKSGLTPIESIVASTKTASECLGMHDITGTLEPKKEADLLVIDGDPLSEIEILQNLDKLLLVMQGGKPVAGPMRNDFPWENPGWPKPAYV